MAFALVAVGALAGGTAGSMRVELVAPFEIIAQHSLSGFRKFRLERMAAIDVGNPAADSQTWQTLSLFGREDLIAAVSKDYAPERCAPLTTASPLFDEIVGRARKTSIVIISESHERTEHRGFITEVAARLRPIGYDTLAIEALVNAPPGTPEANWPPFRKEPALPFFSEGDGHYIEEAGFGRLGRRAKALGYRLLPYEIVQENRPTSEMSVQQQIAVREEAQARNLAAFLGDHPGAKLLIHVGYSHATEVPRSDGSRWMASRLKSLTGIDPLTISQTLCRGNGKKVRLSALPESQPAGSFDLLVDHPNVRFVQGRPEWRRRTGDRAVAIPPALRPTKGWRVIEARSLGEPDTAIAMDRVAIRPGEDIALMLPPGRYRIRAIDLASSDQSPPKPAR
ncbi:MAG: hypothetical protein C0499_05815 [Zymomonas sp.]|nr:hypothetical protein [Zymomonas sp.]